MTVETDAGRLDFLQDWDTALTPGGAVIAGIFDDRYVGIDTTGSIVEADNPIFTCRSSDVATLNHGDALTINGRNYEVRTLKADGTGMTQITLSYIPPFDPANLFVSGAAGLFYDFSEISSLFQDSQGQVPVTDFGQRVGYISDLSGHGLHLTLAVGPGATYIQDAHGYPCLHSDGDSYYTGDDSLLPMGTADCRMSVAGAFDDFSPIANILSYGAPLPNKTRGLILDQSSPEKFCATAWANLVSGTPPIAGDVYVMQAAFEDGNLSLMVNGITQGASDFSYNTQSGNISLFGGAAPAAMMRGRIYGAIIYGQAWDQVAIDLWMAARAGMVLPQYDLLLMLTNHSRATTATWFDPSGIMRTAEVNAARMENSEDGTPMGLLIEESRTNQITHSNDFTGDDWTRQNVTITSDVEPGPDGNLSASRSVTAEFDDRLPHIYPLSCTLPDPLPDWVSVRTWVRRGNYSNGGVNPDIFGNSTAGTDPQDRIFVPIAPKIVRGPGQVSLNPDQGGHEYDLYNLDAHAWTCIETVTTAPLSPAPAYTLTIHNRNQGAGGRGGDYIAVWGQSYEFAPFALSFIPTADLPVTRAADDALVDATWAAEGAGCIYGRFTIIGLPTYEIGTAIIAALTFQNSGANFIQCSIDYRGNFVVAGRSGGQVFTHLNIPGIVAGQEYRFSVAWAPGFSYASINGSATVAQAQTHPIPASPQTFYLGSILQQFYMNGFIRALRYIPYAPTSAELQILSQ